LPPPSASGAGLEQAGRLGNCIGRARLAGCLAKELVRNNLIGGSRLRSARSSTREAEGYACFRVLGAEEAFCGGEGAFVEVHFSVVGGAAERVRSEAVELGKVSVAAVHEIRQLVVVVGVEVTEEVAGLVGDVVAQSAADEVDAVSALGEVGVE